MTLINPIDTSIYYASSQYGGFGGSNGASAPSSSRYNWNTPYVFDPNNPGVMYNGAEKLFKSFDGGLNWTAISGDLTNGSPELYRLMKTIPWFAFPGIGMLTTWPI
ncbi:MAG: hypothetical protein ACOYLC_15495 [Armatimonadaceae bacterium]